MKIVMWVLVAAFAQVAVAVFIAKCMRVGRGPSVPKPWKRSEEPRQALPEAAPARAAINSYADLSALLIALDPQPEKAAAREKEAQLAGRRPNMPGPWPGPQGQ